MPTRRVLIADDDARLTAALEIRLKAAAYEVDVAPDAYQAVAHARKCQPDVLLLDVNMPAGSGLSVPERIKNALGGACIPVIFMTGESREQIAKFASESHVSTNSITVLRKPFDFSELALALDKAFDVTSPDPDSNTTSIEYVI